MSIDSSGRYSPGSTRPPAPWQNSKAAMNLSWHHIIPLAMLRDCWQALATNLDRGKCQVALQSYLRLLKVEAPRGWLKEMAGNSLPFDRQEILDRKITWPPWNVVEGPAFRADDPKSEHELDEYSAGLTETERNRQKRIKELFLAIRIFNRASSGGKVDESAAQAIATVMNQMERTLAAGDVIRFRAAMWMETSAPSLIPRGAENVRWWRKKKH